MNTEGAWGILCLFFFVIASVLLFKGIMHVIGQHHVAALV